MIVSPLKVGYIMRRRHRRKELEKLGERERNTRERNGNLKSGREEILLRSLREGY